MSAYWVWTCVLTTAMTHRGLTLVAVNRGIPWILMDTDAMVCYNNTIIVNNNADNYTTPFR